MDNLTQFKKQIVERNQSNSYSKFLKDSKRELVQFSIDKESRIASFKSRLEVINTKTNKMIKMEHKPLEVARNDYLWFTYNQMLLQDKMASTGEYVALFVTLTLPSSYHRYSSHTKRYNPNFDSSNTIKKGYQLLNDSFREIYKNFRVNRKFEKVFYSRVVEPHKDLTAHLHSIIYVKKEFLNNLINHIKNIIKKNVLGRHDLEVVKNIKRSTAYLLKYVKKNTNPKTEKDFHFFNGWKKRYGIRVFTQSSLSLEKYIFQKVNNVLKLSSGLENKNPISEVLEKCDISINTKCKTTKEVIEKKYKNSNARYKVEINRTRIIHNFVLFTDLDKMIASNESSISISEFNLSSVPGFTDALFKSKAFSSKRIENIKFENMNAYIDYEAECEIKKTVHSELKYAFANNYMNLNEKDCLDIKELLDSKDRYRCALSVFDSYKEKKYAYKIDSFKIVDIETDEVLYNKKNFMLKDDYLDDCFKKGIVEITFN